MRPHHPFHPGPHTTPHPHTHVRRTTHFTRTPTPPHTPRGQQRVTVRRSDRPC